MGTFYSRGYAAACRRGRTASKAAACLMALLVLSVGAPADDLFEIGETRLLAGGGSGEGGPAAEVSLLPQGIAAGEDGAFYYADELFNRIRRVGPDGLVHTVAGSGLYGFNGDGLPALQSAWGVPAALTLGPGGILFAVDLANRQVRALGQDGALYTVLHARQPLFGGMDGVFAPAGLDFDSARRLYVADRGNNVVWQIDPDGRGRRAAGNGMRGFAGDGGLSALGRLADPRAVAIAGDGDIYIADLGNRRVRRVDGGVLQTVAGDGSEDAWDTVVPALEGGIKPLDLAFAADGGLLILDALGPRLLRLEEGRLHVVHTFAAGSDPNALDVAADGRVLLSDYAGRRVYVLGPDGALEAVAGNGSARASGDGGQADAASLFRPADLVAGGQGFYIADRGNGRVRHVDASGGITSVAVAGSEGVPPGFVPDALALDLQGRLHIADGGSQRVWLLDGDGRLQELEGAWGVPTGLAFDAVGGLYVADGPGARVRYVGVNGQEHTVLGGGRQAPADGALPLETFLGEPRGLEVDEVGGLWVVDAGAHRVLRLDPDGLLQVVAGTGTAGRGESGSRAAVAALDAPAGIALDGAGGAFIADSGNGRIVHVGDDGVLRTVAADLGAPTGLSLDAEGGLIYSDLRDHRVYRIDVRRRVAAARERVVAPDLSVRTVKAFARSGLLGLMYQPEDDRLLVMHNNGLERVEADGTARRYADFAARRYTALSTADGIVLATPAVLGRPRPLTLVREIAVDGGKRPFQIPYELYFSGVDEIAGVDGVLYLHQRDGSVLRWRGDNEPPVEHIRVPPGEASLAVGLEGRLFVGLRGEGRVLVVEDGRGGRTLARFDVDLVDLVWADAGLYAGLADGSVYRIEANGSTRLIARGFAPALLALSPGPASSLYVLEGDAAGGRVIHLEPPRHELALWPPQVDWGAVSVGDELRQTLVLRNQGSLPLDLAAASGLGAAVGGQRLEPGSARQVEIVVAAVGRGAVRDTLVFRAADGSLVGRIPLAFFGEAPELRVEEDAIDFGPVEAGLRRGRTVRLANTGNAPLLVEIVEAPAAFGAGDFAPTPIEAGGVAVFELIFAPPAVGVYQGELVLRSDDPAAPVARISLSGAGAAALLPALPERVDLGSVQVGRRTEKKVVLRNEGPVEVRLELAGSGDTQVTAPRRLQLEPGATDSLAIRFSPRRHGDFSGALVLRSNDPRHPVVRLPWRAAAFSTLVGVAPARQDLLPTRLGQARRAVVEVHNRSARPLAILGAGLDNRQFRLLERPTRLAPGAQGRFLIEYRPRIPGPTVANLSVFTDLSEAPVLRARLEAQAQTPTRVFLQPASPERLWPGDEVEVGVRVEGAQSLRGLVLRLHLPPALEYRGAVFADSTLLGGAGLAVRRILADGALEVGLSATGPAAAEGVTGTGEVARLRLAAVNASLPPAFGPLTAAVLRHAGGWEDSLSIDEEPWTWRWTADLDGSGRLDLGDFFLFGEALAAGANAGGELDWDRDGRLGQGDLDVLLRFLGPEAAKAAAAQMPPALEPPWPNPFNGSAVLRYRLPESQDIEVAVYNALGQKVRLLHEGRAAAGGGQLFWDGRDDWGRPAASGIYFAVLKGDGLALHRRLLLLR